MEHIIRLKNLPTSITVAKISLILRYFDINFEVNIQLVEHESK
jgi:hypothetical protein